MLPKIFILSLVFCVYAHCELEITQKTVPFENYHSSIPSKMSKCLISQFPSKNEQERVLYPTRRLMESQQLCSWDNDEQQCAISTGGVLAYLKATNTPTANVLMHEITCLSMDGENGCREEGCNWIKDKCVADDDFCSELKLRATEENKRNMGDAIDLNSRHETADIISGCGDHGTVDACKDNPFCVWSTETDACSTSIYGAVFMVLDSLDLLDLYREFSNKCSEETTKVKCHDVDTSRITRSRKERSESESGESGDLNEKESQFTTKTGKEAQNGSKNSVAETDMELNTEKENGNEVNMKSSSHSHTTSHYHPTYRSASGSSSSSSVAPFSFSLPLLVAVFIIALTLV